MPALWIAHVTVTDEEAYKKYAAGATVAIAEHGGTFIARGGGSLTETCAPTETDSNGRFELAGVPTAHALIEFEVGDAWAAVRDNSA